MDFDGTESQVRKQVEEMLGRPLSDDEWETFKQAQAQGAQSSNSGTVSGRKAGPAGGGMRSLAERIAPVLGFVVAGLLFGTAVAGLLAGLGWAYGIEGLRFDSVGEFLTAAVALWVILGIPVFSILEGSPAATRVVVGCVFFVGLVAIAIGAIIRFA